MSKKAPTPADYLSSRGSSDGKRKKAPSPTLSDLSLKSADISIKSCSELLSPEPDANVASVRTRICQKEGCNKELSVYRKIRCKEHCKMCKKMGCQKEIKNAKTGLCRSHDAPLTTICQKEGCNRILTKNQKTRCKIHYNKCKREGCVKVIANFKTSLCIHHDNPPKICQKEGCNNVLKSNQFVRCTGHKNVCMKKGCYREIQRESEGLCATHVNEKSVRSVTHTISKERKSQKPRRWGKEQMCKRKEEEMVSQRIRK